MTALELGERVPMSIKQARENLRFDFALLQLFIPLLIAGVIFAIGINRRHEQDVLPIGRPDPAIGTGRDVRHLYGADRRARPRSYRSHTSKFASDQSLSKSRSAVCRRVKTVAVLRGSTSGLAAAIHHQSPARSIDAKFLCWLPNPHPRHRTAPTSHPAMAPARRPVSVSSCLRT